MGRRRKRAPRSAYLKHHKTLLDPYHPHAQKMRGVKTLDFTSPIPTTVSTGAHGLTLARVHSIPAVAAQVKRAALEAMSQWSSLRLSGFKDWNRIVLIPVEPALLYLFFQGREWIFVELDHSTMVERRSRSYPSRELAYGALREDSIFWTEVIPIKPPPHPEV